MRFARAQADLGLRIGKTQRAGTCLGRSHCEQRASRTLYAWDFLIGIQRFDRANGSRRFYVSAMTLLRKTQSEGTSYLELAQFIRAQGDAEHADADLQQLFRRVAFNVAVGNRDDHLRNHGFVLGETGWRLAPAFDVNPNIDKAEHVLNIDDVDNRPRLRTVLSTAAFYGLDDMQARQIVDEVVMVVDRWQDAARRIRISGADIALTAGAFSEHKV